MSNPPLVGSTYGNEAKPPRGLRLKSLLPDTKFIGNESYQVQSCCGTWNEVQPDDLYIAMVEDDADGHDFADLAIENGANAILTERLLAVDRPQFIVKDSRKAYGAICQALAGNPSQIATTIGVSGTDGKTVTSHLIHSIMRAANISTGLYSSIQTGWNSYVDSQCPPKATPPALAGTLAKMVMNNCTHAVVEAPNESLAKHFFSGVELDVAVLTNIRRDHLTYHTSPENYQRAKTRMLDYLKPTGFAVLNADDPQTFSLLDEIEVPTLTIGIHQAAEVTAKMIDRWPSEQTFFIQAGNQTVPVRTSQIGKHHIYNCLSAAAVALTLGIDLPTIARGLESADHIPGRLERVECGQDYGVWIDSAHTPSQLATALQTLRGVVDGNIYCVLSTQEGQSSLHRKKLGQIAERAADYSVITRNHCADAIDYEPFHQVLDGFENESKPQLVPSRFKAIQWALANAKQGDAVLITGKGQQPFTLLGDEAWPVCDRDVCEAWLFDHACLENQADDNEGDPDVFNIDDYR